MKKILFICLLLAIGFAAGWFLRPDDDVGIVKVVTKTDTIKCIQPSEKDSVSVRYITRWLPLVAPAMETTPEVAVGGQPALADSMQMVGLEVVKNDSKPPDSVEVAIPITQKYYETPNYRAWVSGYEAKLDSCITYKETETIYLSKKRRRWSVVLGGGLSLTTDGKIRPALTIAAGLPLY